MTWYREAECELENLAAAIRSHQRIRIDRLEVLRTALVSALKQTDELVEYALSSPRGSPVITNLINVGILGTKVGMGMGYYGEELERLALAGLVHDIGIFSIPQSLLLRASRLTGEERTLIEQHSELGYELICSIGPAYHWLAQVVRQVHERCNGKGYPNRLKSGQIAEMAQILGLVDIFDALVSERPYRHRLLPYEAIAELLSTERGAFPREIVKVLVQQITPYPVGTIVRLTTGETARVCRVNSRYPLRPTVEIFTNEAGKDIGMRKIDLSRTPLLSVLQTVAPPNAPEPRDPSSPIQQNQPSPPAAAPNQVSSLLTSLDEIVSAIEGIVETRIEARSEVVAKTADHENSGHTRASSPATREGGFHKEIIGLFALEAREWLGQIQTALQKLASGAEGPLQSKLYGFILNGILNLGRSASAVHLSDIEAMASNLLPILRDVGRTESQWTAETLRPLQHGLDRIADAVRRLAGERTDERGPGISSGSAPPMREEPSVQRGERSAPSQSAPQTEGRVASSVPLLRRLKELQRARARSFQPVRDMLDAVIERAQQEFGERQDYVGVDAIRRILHELDRADEEFLREVHERIPKIGERISQLRRQGAPAVGMASLLEQVDALHRLAKTIDAGTMMMFLEGVRSFLMATADRTANTLPQHWEAVEERIKRLVPMAEQWVTLGRLERTFIEEILPE